MKTKKVIETFIVEMQKGKFLHINASEDGDGTWFDLTSSEFEAYQHDLDVLREITQFEFSNFEKGYPKFHKVRFTVEKLKTRG